jgi:hypothetical protein
MANPNKSKLDASQCVVGAYDGVEEAQRVIIASATEFGIELSAADGDSISSYSALSSASISVAQTPATAVSAVLLTVSDVEGYSKLVVYSEGLAGISGSGKVYIQASPSASGSVWATIGSEVTSPASVGYAASSVTEFVAKRIRLISSAAPTGGNVQYTVVLGS